MSRPDERFARKAIAGGSHPGDCSPSGAGWRRTIAWATEDSRRFGRVGVAAHDRFARQQERRRTAAGRSVHENSNRLVLTPLTSPSATSEWRGPSALDAGANDRLVRGDVRLTGEAPIRAGGEQRVGSRFAFAAVLLVSTARSRPTGRSSTYAFASTPTHASQWIAVAARHALSSSHHRTGGLRRVCAGCQVHRCKL